jgi:hypothetical protein
MHFGQQLRFKVASDPVLMPIPNTVKSNNAIGIGTSAHKAPSRLFPTALRMNTLDTVFCSSPISIVQICPAAVQSRSSSGG